MNTGFVLQGLNFDYLPNDALGIMAVTNDNPLLYIDSGDETLLYHIVDKESARLELVCNSPNNGHSANYLGAIVSADRQTIYWVNDKKPLP